jgi:hypothetical protein
MASPCRHALDGCKRCALGYHCPGICAADSREARERRRLAHHVARKRARREKEAGR